MIFLVSGEMYHRAWSGRSVPDAGLNQFADVLSAVGGLLLTLGLVFVGQWMLAIPSGLLVIGGKLGSALFGDVFRSGELSALAPVQPAVLVLCYMLWIRADYLLVAGARATVRQKEEASDARSH